MKFLYSILFLVIIGCSPKIIPLKGSYSDGNFEGYSDKKKDQVWDNIIDFFAKNGIPIRIIDRSSGLITSGEARAPITWENSKGELVDKNAYIVVQKIVDPGTRKPIPFQNVTTEWNVRIKEVEGKTLINVNMVNPYYTAIGDKERKMFKKGAFQSTDVFEKMIYDLVK